MGGRERDKERETLIGCLSYVPQQGMEPTTYVFIISPHCAFFRHLALCLAQVRNSTNSWRRKKEREEGGQGGREENYSVVQDLVVKTLLCCPGTELCIGEEVSFN